MPAARQQQARLEADASIAIAQLEADRRDAAATARQAGLAVSDLHADMREPRPAGVETVCASSCLSALMARWRHCYASAGPAAASAGASRGARCSG
jgi:hypothetical protein